MTTNAIKMITVEMSHTHLKLVRKQIFASVLEICEKPGLLIVTFPPSQDADIPGKHYDIVLLYMAGVL